MPEQPTVCAVMLTADRPEMARRAVECFRAQSYDATGRFLLIFDTGNLCWYDARSDSENESHVGFGRGHGMTIGELRNEANRITSRFDALIHWDSDDWSHPNRIAEQVALLQSSGADAVGYREMLFWREDARSYDECHREVDPYGEAWLYSNPDPRYCIGTSLCYWRKTWERVPFQALPKTKGGNAEDNEWLKSVLSLGCPAFKATEVIHDSPSFSVKRGIPRMVARIHASNTSDYASVLGRSHNWRRMPEWDSYCRSVME